MQNSGEELSADPYRATTGSLKEEQRVIDFLDEWNKKSVERLEETARLLTQLVPVLYGLLFGLLAFGDSPQYLQQTGVLSLGILSVISFFIALVASLISIMPIKTQYRAGSIRDKLRAIDQMIVRKHRLLRASVWMFIAGTGFLGGTVIAILLKF